MDIIVVSDVKLPELVVHEVSFSFRWSQSIS